MLDRRNNAAASSQAPKKFPRKLAQEQKQINRKSFNRKQML